jgi:hypothetical protein
MEWIIGEAHQPKLAALAKDAVKIEISVAFLSDSGAAFILELAKRREVEVTVSLFMGTTRKSALTALVEELRPPADTKLKVRVAQATTAGFHGKVYGFWYADGTSAWVVGSANATHTGLSGQGDVSVVLRDPPAQFKWTPALEKAMQVSGWATAEEYKALDEIIGAYKEALHRGGPTEEDEGKVWYFRNIRDANNTEKAAVAAHEQAGALTGPANDGQSEAPTTQTWLIFGNTQADGPAYRLLSKARRGDVVVQRYQDGREIRAAVVHSVRPLPLKGNDAVLAYFEPSVSTDRVPPVERVKRNRGLSQLDIDTLAEEAPALIPLLRQFMSAGRLNPL